MYLDLGDGDERGEVWLDDGMEIRPATIDDARILLAWRNDPLTRAMSKTTELVAWEDHVRWLERRLAGEEPNLFIARSGGVSVGTFRIDDGEISYTISPQHRRLGFAVEMLRIAAERFGPLRAEIKADNHASIRAAEKAGHHIHLI